MKLCDRCGKDYCICHLIGTDFNTDKFLAWLRDPRRKPANTAFTAGAERQAAYAIEDSGLVLRPGQKGTDAEVAFLLGRLMNLGFDVEGRREAQLDLALSMSMEIITKIVDSEECPIGIRCDAQELLRRWQRGEFLKKERVPSLECTCQHPVLKCLLHG